MSQIYNGSFVLGDTSATTLSAGPGIKLDTSVPGVIGISNDETVLFDSYGNGTSAAVLSEPMSSFSQLKILLGQQYTNDGTEWHTYEAKPDKIKHMSYCAGGDNNFYFVGLYCTANSNTAITVVSQASVVKPYGNTNVNGQGENEAYKNCIHKVVGINRIAGGN